MMMEVDRVRQTTDGEIDFIAIVRMLWKRKFLIIGIGFVCAAIAGALGFVMPHSYRAEVVLTEVTDDILGNGGSLPQQLGGLAALTGLARGDDRTREARALLASRYLVQEFVTRENSVGELVSDPQQPQALWFAVRRFKTQVLKVREDIRKGTTTIEVTWKDPETAAKWANEFVALANELIRTRALEDATRNVTYLNAQLDKTQVMELRQVLYKLIEAETKKLMLANARAEYAFAVVDPAVRPGQRVSPRRTIMVLVGGVLGVMLGCLVVLIRGAISAGTERGVIA